MPQSPLPRRSRNGNPSSHCSAHIAPVGHDALNRLELETVTHGTATLASYDYVLLPDGQRDYVLETDSLGGQTKIDWTYDALDRLISETYDVGNDGQNGALDYLSTYTLDLVGNRLGKTVDAADNAKDETITASFNAKDQLLGETSSLSGASSYSYDANGSTIAKTAADQTVQYVYDLENHLVGYDANGDDDTNDVGDATYGYNSDGQRVSRTVMVDANNDGVPEAWTTLYVVDTNNPTGYSQVLEEKGAKDATPDKAYVLGQDVLAQQVAGVLNYLLYDGHGNTRLLASAVGAILQSFHYDAFGNPIGFNPAQAATALLYCGEYFDPITSRYHLRARDYDPSIGRFVSRDPYLGEDGEPATLHKYLYANANPIAYIDPTGNRSLGELLVVAGVKALLYAQRLYPVVRLYDAYLTARDLVETVQAIGTFIGALQDGVDESDFDVIYPFAQQFVINRAQSLTINLVARTLGPVGRRLTARLAAQMARIKHLKPTAATIQATRDFVNKQRQKHPAGSSHTSGYAVFDKNGLPKFHSQYIAKDSMGNEIRRKIDLTGSRSVDAAIASHLAGLRGSSPVINGVQYTWHHDSHLGDMVLVRTDVHTTVGHGGGAALWAYLMGMPGNKYGK